jgi:hypothetical protein
LSRHKTELPTKAESINQDFPVDLLFMASMKCFWLFSRLSSHSPDWQAISLCKNFVEQHIVEFFSLHSHLKMVVWNLYGAQALVLWHFAEGEEGER